MAVITVSRQMGSLGTEIAQEVAGQLHYEYLDKEGIEQGITTQGLAVQEVDKFDEKSPPFWTHWQLQGWKFLSAIQLVIYHAACRGNVVIVGRGGQILLKTIPGVFHVRIIAPFQDRVERLLAKNGGNEKQLLRTLKQSDRDSAGFIRTFFDADWDDADLYDLTINTHHVPVDLATEMILRAIPTYEAEKGTQESRERLDDLILQQKVATALLNVDHRNIHIEVTGGVVTVSGQVSSSAEDARIIRLVSKIEGVKKVEDMLAIYESYAT